MGTGASASPSSTASSVVSGQQLPTSLSREHPEPIPAWADLRPPEGTPPKHSILSGNEDSTFSISADSGNLTMTKSIPNAKAFLLVVKVGAHTRPCSGPQLQNMQLKDQLVTVVSQTPRVSRLITPDTP